MKKNTTTIIKNCRECGNDFTHDKTRIKVQKYCCKRCSAYGKYRTNLIINGLSVEEADVRVRAKKIKNPLDKKLLNIKKEINGELKEDIMNFITELKRKCLYLDAIDAFKLVGFYVDVFGPSHFDKISIEEELYICYKRLEEII
jgi:hypothetical protein